MTDSTTLERLAVRASAGDESAMSELHERLHVPVLAWIHGKVDDPSKAEAIARETWVNAAREVTHYQPGTHLMSWLRDIGWSAESWGDTRP